MEELGKLIRKFQQLPKDKCKCSRSPARSLPWRKGTLAAFWEAEGEGSGREKEGKLFL